MKRPTSGLVQLPLGNENSLKNINLASSHESRSLDCLYEQIKVIAVFYISYVCLDFLMQIIGNEIIDKEVECQNDFVINPTDNVGAGYFLV